MMIDQRETRESKIPACWHLRATSIGCTRERCSWCHSIEVSPQYYIHIGAVMQLDVGRFSELKPVIMQRRFRGCSEGSEGFHRLG